MHRILLLAVITSCVIPPPDATTPTPATAPTDTAAVSSGAWKSEDWASVTNPAMTSADFYLEITLVGDGMFEGGWARYLCQTQTYGIWSCGKGPLEGAASGQLAADGTGFIELENLGSSALVWSGDASSISIELPRDWQGEDAVLFRSALKR